MNYKQKFARAYKYFRPVLTKASGFSSFMLNLLHRASPGLTLIEVVLTILIVGVSTTALLSLQLILSRGVFNAHNLVTRLYPLKNVLVKADTDQLAETNKPFTQKLEDPPLTVSYTTQKLSDKPGFKQFPYMVVERVEGTWTGLLGKQQKEALVALKFQPPVQQS